MTSLVDWDELDADLLTETVDLIELLFHEFAACRNHLHVCHDIRDCIYLREVLRHCFHPCHNLIESTLEDLTSLSVNCLEFHFHHLAVFC